MSTICFINSSKTFRCICFKLKSKWNMDLEELRCFSQTTLNCNQNRWIDHNEYSNEIELHEYGNPSKSELFKLIACQSYTMNPF